MDIKQTKIIFNKFSKLKYFVLYLLELKSKESDYKISFFIKIQL
jgi:hypothetical protein